MPLAPKGTLNGDPKQWKCACPRHANRLVFGATGGIGGETAIALLRHGWHVKALARVAAPDPYVQLSRIRS